MTLKQPLLVTCAIISDKNRLLLVKRAREPFKDYWAFISGCGAFEKTSNPLEAVKLEVNGDISCQFKPAFFNYKYEPGEKAYVVLYFYGIITGTPVINPKYISEYKWVSFEEAENIDLAFGQEKALLEFLRGVKP